MSESGGRPSQILGSGREALTNAREWLGGLPNVREWLKGYFDCPGVVERPSRMTGIGRVAFPDVQEW